MLGGGFNQRLEAAQRVRGTIEVEPSQSEVQTCLLQPGRVIQRSLPGLAGFGQLAAGTQSVGQGMPALGKARGQARALAQPLQRPVTVTEVVGRASQVQQAGRVVGLLRQVLPAVPDRGPEIPRSVRGQRAVERIRLVLCQFAGLGLAPFGNQKLAQPGPRTRGADVVAEPGLGLVGLAGGKQGVSLRGSGLGHLGNPRVVRYGDGRAQVRRMIAWPMSSRANASTSSAH